MLILVVDDDPDHRQALRTLIEGEGDEVIEAGSADDAVTIVRAYGIEIDVVIVDYYLGGTQTGADVAREVPRGTALFCVSGHTQRDIRATFPDPFVGFLAFFEKPIKWDEPSWDGPRPGEPGMLQWLQRVRESKEATVP
jgi:CheY-like chemotaxis protein